MSEDEPLEPLDEHSDEEMRLENDIMKLKLQAEFGAKFGEIDADMPPELEHQFLKHVYDFEKAWQNQEIITVASMLDAPDFIPYEDLAEEGKEQAWQDVLNLYTAKNISVDFNNEYPLELKYRFATEELPLHETMFVNMPGMMLGFIYEEFHPNHAADMEARVSGFLEGWLEMNTEKCVQAISDEFMTGQGILLSKDDLIRKLSQVFDSFDKFNDAEFVFDSTSYDMQYEDPDTPGVCMGYVEGGMRWSALMENGEVIPFSGPFKFYLEYKLDWWSIVYFILPGWQY